MKLKILLGCFIIATILIVVYGLKFKQNIITLSNNKIIPKYFNNIAIVTLDSCKKWEFPLTSFLIEYPDQYSIEYNADSRYYLRLRKFNKKGIVIQEITIGKNYNIDNKKKAIRNLSVLDSILSANLKIYKRKFIGKEQINNNSYYVLISTLNFDELGNKIFQNNYSSLCLFIFPPNKKINGLAISFLFNENELQDGNKISNEALIILKSIKFKY